MKVRIFFLCPGKSIQPESVIQQEFGVDVSVFAEDDEDVYDPKGKARHARPYKPAILIE